MEANENEEKAVFRMTPSMPGEGAIERRTHGARRARQLSNWTLAALLVGIGAGAAELAHLAPPSGYSYSTSAGTGVGANGHRSALGSAVATSSGSTVASGGASPNGTGGAATSFGGDS